jgi:hypothetical protein
MEPNKEFSDAEFAFDAKKFPDVEIIDLRWFLIRGFFVLKVYKTTMDSDSWWFCFSVSLNPPSFVLIGIALKNRFLLSSMGKIYFSHDNLSLYFNYEKNSF